MKQLLLLLLTLAALTANAGNPSTGDDRSNALRRIAAESPADPCRGAALAYDYCWAMFPRESEEACPIRALSARLRYGKYFADNGASVEITL